MIAVKTVDLSNGKLVYLAEDLALTSNTIFLPDLTQSVNSCIQIMTFNGITNSYALDWRYHGESVAQGPIDVMSFAQDLQEFVTALQLKDYQIVAAGLSFFVVLQAIQAGLLPRQVVALDPKWRPQLQYRKTPPILTYSELIAFGQHQVQTLQQQQNLDDYQRQMLLNAIMADFHQMPGGFELYVNQQQQGAFVQSISQQLLPKTTVPMTLLIAQTTQDQLPKAFAQVPQLRAIYQRFTQSYVLQKIQSRQLLVVAPLEVLNFLA